LDKDWLTSSRLLLEPEVSFLLMTSQSSHPNMSKDDSRDAELVSAGTLSAVDVSLSSASGMMDSLDMLSLTSSIKGGFSLPSSCFLATARPTAFL